MRARDGKLTVEDLAAPLQGMMLTLERLRLGWVDGRACPTGESGLHQAHPISSRLLLYPQMAADPIHGHPPWALVLVAVSVGESAGKAGPAAGRGTGCRRRLQALFCQPS